MEYTQGLKKWLDEHFDQPGVAFYSFLGCLVTMSLIGLGALLLHWPLLFPSLSPTVILFFERGERPAAWPRNIFIAHGVAIASGWISLAAFDLLAAPHALITGITPARLGAAALSVALTAFVKHLFHAPHPPAGATTLIISLGFFTTAFQLGVMAVSIVLVTIFGWLLNRILGGAMPLWGKGSRTS